MTSLDQKKKKTELSADRVSWFFSLYDSLNPLRVLDVRACVVLEKVGKNVHLSI